MTTRKPKQPVVWVEEETPLEEALKLITDDWIEAGNYCEATIATLRDACLWLLAGRAAAADSDSAPDEEKTRSLQRVDRLCARWRDNARTMDELADECDGLGEEKDSAECLERARTFRECANDLATEWAGTEPISVLPKQ